MDLRAVVRRIDEKLAERKLNATKASKEAGLSADAIRNMKRALKTGSHSGVSIKTLSALAPVLDTTVGWLLDGEPASDIRPDPIYVADDPSDPDPVDPDWDGQAAALIDGRVRFSGSLAGSVPEIPSSPGAGPGRYEDARAAQIQTGGIATGHPVINEWVIPANYVRNTLDAQPSGIVLMGVIGHSMAPLLEPGDKVMVDTSQSAWVGDAIYVIDDGDTVFQVKTLKKVTSSHPPRFRIVSESSPGDEVVRSADEFRIVGRVVGRFTRM